jgi:hypothetical protein
VDGQAAINLPADLARQQITEALGRLDRTIHQNRDHAFTGGQGATPHPRPPNDAQ